MPPCAASRAYTNPLASANRVKGFSSGECSQWQPWSNGRRKVVVSVKARPPIRSRPSSTSTRRPAFCSRRAAASPDTPAPMMMASWMAMGTGGSYLWSGACYRSVIRPPALATFPQLPRLDSCAPPAGDAAGAASWRYLATIVCRREDSNRAWQAICAADSAASPPGGRGLLLRDPVRRADPHARAAFPADSAHSRGGRYGGARGASAPGRPDRPVADPEGGRGPARGEDDRDRPADDELWPALRRGRCLSRPLGDHPAARHDHGLVPADPRGPGGGSGTDEGRPAVPVRFRPLVLSPPRSRRCEPGLHHVQ